MMGMITRGWRCVGTAASYAGFGIGALALSQIAFPLIRAFSKDESSANLRVRATVSASFRFFLGCMQALGVCRIRFESLEKVLGNSRCVIVANHPTLLDYVFLASRIPDSDCVVKAALLKNPFLSRVVNGCRYLVNDTPEQMLEECRRRFAAEERLLIFPEGTRTVPGAVMKLHRGAAQVALKYNAPIEVVRIECSEAWLTKRQAWWYVPPKMPEVRIRYVATLMPQANVAEHDHPHEARRLTNEIAQALGLNKQE